MPDSYEFDLLILGGTVIDGTKIPRYDADVGILGDTIAVIGDLSKARAPKVIDARGKIVAPGFIDAHTHDDQAILVEPQMTAKVSQGVTTVVTGNCGVSAAPLPLGAPLPMPLSLLDRDELRFAAFGAFLDSIRRSPPAVNVVPLVGHSSLRACTMTDMNRPATETEIDDMRSLLSDALDAGAFGLSTGLFYPTAKRALTSEVIEVGRALSSRNALYVTHMRDESDDVMTSLAETFQIGRELDVKVIISHHKVGNRRNHGRSAQTLAFIQKTMKQQAVCLDCYPYDAGSTMISTDPNLLDGRVLVVASDPHPECAGRDLGDIALEWGVSKEEAAQRLQPGSAIYFLLSETDVQRILEFPPTMIGSDGLPGTSKPHPRLWGTFPRVLGRYCRELGLFPLETAIWKMTGLTARNFGIENRGTISVGMAADLVVFDAGQVIDRADYDHPTRTAVGIEYVVANGQLTWKHGVHTEICPGRLLHPIRQDCAIGSGQRPSMT
ncbi:D-aminoacylase [Paraburkholderia xenovorans]|uniref:N-acyl-D-amino-acid deacylase family protein n=1 Tax=Paraburkholderia xenovorans TaxID=36873 RepID=UPI0038B948B2